MNDKIILEITQQFQRVIPRWREMIKISFLSQQMQEKYLYLLDERCKRLEL